MTRKVWHGDSATYSRTGSPLFSVCWCDLGALWQSQFLLCQEVQRCSRDLDLIHVTDHAVCVRCAANQKEAQHQITSFLCVFLNTCTNPQSSTILLNQHYLPTCQAVPKGWICFTFQSCLSTVRQELGTDFQPTSQPVLCRPMPAEVHYAEIIPRSRWIWASWSYHSPLQCLMLKCTTPRDDTNTETWLQGVTGNVCPVTLAIFIAQKNVIFGPMKGKSGNSLLSPVSNGNRKAVYSG